MSFPERKPDSLHGLELHISLFLRWGVLCAGVLILLGWLMLLIQGESVSKAELSEYNPMTLQESLEWALIFKDRGQLISVVGIFALILLPVIRVFLTGYLFMQQREFKMAALTFAVFLVLIGSFFLGIEP